MQIPEVKGRERKTSDLLYIFEELYRRGKITEAELDKCSQKVMEGNY